MSVLNNSNAIESGGYNIDRSLRFRSSASAYLNRTPASVGNVYKWTVSFWIKKTQNGTAGSADFMSAYNGASSNTEIRFNSSDQIVWYYSGSGTALVTNQVFRDISSWYHMVFVFDSQNATASLRARIYVNGVEITSFATDNRASMSGNISAWNNNVAHTFMYGNGASVDGYIAEFYNIDGQALTPSSFGQTDAVTGVWQPKKYTGTYGTNGFYLDFKDNTSATTLAYDKSGNGNNWTPNNISTTAGATYDSMTDVPTLTSATATNFAVMNPLNSNATISGGNLNLTYASPLQTKNVGTISIVGKTYFEAAFGGQTGTNNTYFGVGSNPSYAAYNSGSPLGADSFAWAVGTNNTEVGKRGAGVYTTLAAGASSAGDIFMVAVDPTSGKIWFGKNGIWYGSGDPANGANAAFTGLPSELYPIIDLYGSSGSQTVNANFGQRPFSYTPPTGFKALNTYNLPDPVIKKPNQYMDATTYTGNGSTQSIVNAGGFQPDLVWVKNRTTTGNNNLLVDSVRGVNGATSTLYTLFSDATSAEQSDPTNSGQAVYYGALSSLNSNGFSVKAGTGGAGQTDAASNSYVGWQWKKGATPGFDIVTYTGTGVAQNISHSLGVAPKMVIVKARNSSSDWSVYTATTGAGGYLLLNTGDLSAASSTKWNNTAPTSSVFSVGIDTTTNMAATTYVAYLFAEIPGFSKIGSYVGNNSTDGPFVFCGFRPKYVLIKKYSGGGGADWHLHDTARDTYNASNSILLPDSSSAELTNTAFSLDILSNGFKLRTLDASTNGPSYSQVFMAFAENPFKYSLAR